jgi:hypothetical protein
MRLNDTAHNEPHALTIDRPYLSSSEQSIKLLSFHSGDGFCFLDLPFARIVNQSAAYPGSIRRIATTSPSQRSLNLIQAVRKAHLIALRNGTTGFVLTAIAASISAIRRTNGDDDLVVSHLHLERLCLLHSSRLAPVILIEARR